MRSRSGQPAHVLAVEPEHVEDVEEDRGAWMAAGAGSWSARPRRRRPRRRPRTACAPAPQARRRRPGSARSATGRCGRAACTGPPSRIAMQRMPSSLRSKIQSGSLKRSSVRTAFIAPAVVGAGAHRRGPTPLRGAGRPSAGRSSRRACSSSSTSQTAPIARMHVLGVDVGPQRARLHTGREQHRERPR